MGCRAEIRRAEPTELAWVNARYREVEFVPSDEGDLVALAELEGKPAGLGRIVPIAPGIGELGGMYVLEECRGHGVAKAIIDFLLAETDCRLLYCIPFSNLEALYRAAGFERLSPGEAVPDKIAEKHRWCNTFYDSEVLLMKRSLTAAPDQAA